MKSSLGGYICGMRQFGRFKCPDSHEFLVDSYFRNKRLSCWRIVNSEKAGLIFNIWSALILTVKRIRGFSKVFNSVVARIAVYVINKAVRKLSINIQPREPMAVIRLTANMHFDVSVTVKTSGTFSDPVYDATGRRFQPSKFASVGVV